MRIPPMLPAFCMIVFLSSCYPYAVPGPVTIPETRQKENYLHAPSAQNAPLLTKKNDISGSLQGSFGEHHSAFDLQAAFVPVQHLGLMTAYSSGGNNDGEIKYNHFEIGAGYIGKLSRLWYFETYTGYGTGKTDNQYATGLSIVKHASFFMQPAFTFVNRKKNIQLGFVAKFTGTHFDIVNASFLPDQEPYSNNQIQLLYRRPVHLFYEPGVVFRFGWENFLFHTGLSYATDLTSSELHYMRENITAGVYVKFNTGKN